MPTTKACPYKGNVIAIVHRSPGRFILGDKGSQRCFSTISTTCEGDTKGRMRLGGDFLLRQKPCAVTTMLSRDMSSTPVRLSKICVSLFSGSLPMLARGIVHPNRRNCLCGIGQVSKQTGTGILYNTSEVCSRGTKGQDCSFITGDPLRAAGTSEVLLPGRPVQIYIGKGRRPRPRGL